MRSGSSAPSCWDEVTPCIPFPPPPPLLRPPRALPPPLAPLARRLAFRGMGCAANAPTARSCTPCSNSFSRKALARSPSRLWPKGPAWRRPRSTAGMRTPTTCCATSRSPWASRSISADSTPRSTGCAVCSSALSTVSTRSLDSRRSASCCRRATTTSRTSPSAWSRPPSSASPISSVAGSPLAYSAEM